MFIKFSAWSRNTFFFFLEKNVKKKNSTQKIKILFKKVFEGAITR